MDFDGQALSIVCFRIRSGEPEGEGVVSGCETRETKLDHLLLVLLDASMLGCFLLPLREAKLNRCLLLLHMAGVLLGPRKNIYIAAVEARFDMFLKIKFFSRLGRAHVGLGSHPVKSPIARFFTCVQGDGGDVFVEPPSQPIVNFLACIKDEGGG